MTPPEPEPFDASYREILEAIKGYYPGFGKREEELLQKSFRYGEEFFKDKKRLSGEPYFTHALETLKILLRIKPDMDTIIGCLLYNTVRDPKSDTEVLKREFGERVALLCENMRKVSKLKLLKDRHTERQYENIQKLLVVVSQDIRVLFVKLAARIHNLRTIEFIPKEKADRLAREAQEIFAPVAEKLGLFEFKTEMEDLCLKYLQPKAYKTLTEEITASEKERLKIIEEAKKEITKAIESSNLPVVDIHGRQKNIMSIYNKIKRKNLNSVKEVHDLFGLRVIVGSVEDCYRTLGLLHSCWRPMANRFKDYIALPKPNGYQSLHTTLLGVGRSSFPTEVQIRTDQMHADAEWGPAAHWAYKKAKHSNFDQNYIKRMSWLPTAEIGKEESREKIFKELSNNIFADHVYIFTPKGDIETLPAGSTPVDFAYAIHSDVGDACIGARVNGLIKPIDYKLQNGEVVEILTKKGRNPNPDWLDFVRSENAKEHIRAFINKLKKNVPTPSIPAKSLLPKDLPKKSRTVSFPPKAKVGLDGTEVIIGGGRNIPYKVANCCEIQFGQDIVAYKSRGLHFSLHRIDCPQLQKLDPKRFVEAYLVQRRNLEIHAFDRIGLFRDYATATANHGVNIVSEFDVRHFYDESNRSVVFFKLLVEVPSEEETEKLAQDIRHIPGVLSVDVLT